MIHQVNSVAPQAMRRGRKIFCYLAHILAHFCKRNFMESPPVIYMANSCLAKKRSKPHVPRSLCRCAFFLMCKSHDRFKLFQAFEKIHLMKYAFLKQSVCWLCLQNFSCCRFHLQPKTNYLANYQTTCKENNIVYLWSHYHTAMEIGCTNSH